MQNYQLTYNRTFTPNLTNQLVSGVNYFNQVFNDDKIGFDIGSVGLVDGSVFKDAPELQISGFDSTGRTPPEGRNDITGQISDNLSWVKGKHQIALRRRVPPRVAERVLPPQGAGRLQIQRRAGNWDLSKSSLASTITDPSVTARLLSLADYLAGDIQTAQITLGQSRAAGLCAYLCVLRAGFLPGDPEAEPQRRPPLGL